VASCGSCESGTTSQAPGKEKTPTNYRETHSDIPGGGMMYVDIVGLDLSLTRSGISLHYGATHVRTYTLSTPDKLPLQERIDMLVKEVWPSIKTSFVFIEAHIMGGKGKSYDRAEMAGVLKYIMWKHKRPYFLIAPGTLKKWATGSGSGEKSPVLHMIAKKTGFEGKNDDESDAYCAADMGYHLLFPDAPKRPLLEYEKKILLKYKKENPFFRTFFQSTEKT
jgi:Holliday junction resolvasome RuvABC endonuclease subunit